MKIVLKKIEINKINNNIYINEICKHMVQNSGQVVLLNFNIYHNYISYNEYKNIEQIVSKVAKQTNMYIITSLLRVNETNSLYCIVCNKNGEIIKSLNKEYSELNTTYSKEFITINTDYGNVGVVMGSDLWTMEVPRILALKGAELLIVPDLLYENNCEVEFIKGISALSCIPIIYAREREDDMQICISSTKNKLEINEVSDIFVKEIDIDEVKKLRVPDLSFKNTLWWVLKGRRPENYKEILNIGKF